jgi:macrolide-specific efflux system membrane fusion protein
MEIDPTISLNELETAKNELARLSLEKELKEELYLYELNLLKRSKDMYKLGGITKEELERKTIEVKQKKLDFTNAQYDENTAILNVNTNQAQLKYTKIYSPINGTVVSLLGEEGQTLVSTQQVSKLLTISNTEKLRVKLPISEFDITTVKISKPIQFSLLGRPEKNYHSVITSIDNVPSENNDDAVFYNTYFGIDSSLSSNMRIGMSVKASIIIEKAEGVLIIPNQYLTNTSENRYLISILEDGKVTNRQVETGLRGMINTEIKSGVKFGEKVVLL